MEYFWYRGRKCKECNEPVAIFALGHYLPKEAKKEDEFSRKLNYFYMYGNESEFSYFLKRLLEFYEKRVKGDVDFDLICVCPSHSEGKVNKNMVKLAKKFSEKTGIPYKEVLKRKRTVASQHLLKTDKERVENVKESFVVEEDLTEKKIVILDNTSVSGATAREVHKVMKKKNAETSVFICLGLGHKGKDIDFDINPAFRGKISFIISKWNWPKVSKEKRAEFKSKKT